MLLLPLRSRAVPDRVSNHLTDVAARRANMVINRELNEETLDLRDEVLSTSMFEEIVGSSGAISRVTDQILKVCSVRRDSSDYRRDWHRKGVDRSRDSQEVA
jgi:hypothetical protein